MQEIQHTQLTTSHTRKVQRERREERREY